MDQPNIALPPIEEDRRGGLRAKTITKLETAKPGTTDHTIDSNSMQDFVERQRTEAPPASRPAGPASNQGQPDAGSAVVGLVRRGSVERHEPLSAERRQELFKRGAVEATPPAPGAQPSKNEQKQKKPQSASAPNSALALAAPSGAGQNRNLSALPGLNQPQQPVVQNQIRQAVQPPNTEEYAPLVENDFEPVSAANTLSTFSIDVDTASYANVRRFLSQSLLPPPDAVRIEEMVNYFSYHYPSPGGGVPFSVNTEVTRCPWEPDHQIVRIGLKGEEVRFEDRRPTNLVFVVDVSGSMTPANKLPVVKAGLRMLAEQLSENDRISIVVYAGQAGMALPSTTGDHKQTIVRAIDALQAGGSTNGAGGIEMAYDEAVQHFLKGGVNRVILATDGDFNVGTSDAGSLARIAEEKAKTGVFLSVLGVGGGNLNDHLMESIADKGNGNYSYLDNLDEARKVLVEQVGGTLVTIAKDVKIQVDFNPATVGAYRLIGYENRKLANRDFRDDTKDSGEIGSGHTVTALSVKRPTSLPRHPSRRSTSSPPRLTKTPKTS
jgi:Ca-activated chloride channel family protein